MIHRLALEAVVSEFEELAKALVVLCFVGKPQEDSFHSVGRVAEHELL